MLKGEKNFHVLTLKHANTNTETNGERDQAEKFPTGYTLSEHPPGPVQRTGLNWVEWVGSQNSVQKRMGF
jgi:hypothetical protein